MPDSRDWQRWVAYAVEDFELAEEILKQRPRQASFQLQQSAEKYLKAALIAQSRDSSRTHDLVLLVIELDATLTVDNRVVAAAQASDIDWSKKSLPRQLQPTDNRRSFRVTRSCPSDARLR